MKKRKNRSLLGRILSAVAVAAPALEINQFAYPTIQSRWVTETVENLKNSGEVSTDNIYFEGLEEKAIKLTPRDFVNLANKIVHQRSKPNHECRHYATATREIYLKLIRMANRQDLADSINECFDDEHAWIEINENGKFVPYESMHRTPEYINVDSVVNYSLRNASNRKYLNGGPNRTAHSRIYGDSNEAQPTLDSISHPGGVLGFLASAKIKQLK
ncbi:hypothetical protein HYV50_02205 [Candidatus Pacearchaeota archaeon]|nr:hypothetical protein [Candidatus Pacearchaeota archaeon]